MSDGDLLGQGGLPAAEKGRHGGARAGAGRPAGSENQVNRDLRRWLVAVTGREAIAEMYELASRPVMTDAESLDALAKHLGCSRLKAAEFWRACAAEVFPYVYPKLGAIEVRAAGAPGSGELAPVDGELPVVGGSIDGEFERVA